MFTTSLSTDGASEINHVLRAAVALKPALTQPIPISMTFMKVMTNTPMSWPFRVSPLPLLSRACITPPLSLSKVKPLTLVLMTNMCLKTLRMKLI
eukprot:11189543-Karenia_brevis.AAC.1